MTASIYLERRQRIISYSGFTHYVINFTYHISKNHHQPFSLFTQLKTLNWSSLDTHLKAVSSTNAGTGKTACLISCHLLGLHASSTLLSLFSSPVLYETLYETLFGSNDFQKCLLKRLDFLNSYFNFNIQP